MVKPDWTWVAPRLASLYHRGVLAPFIGAGLSRPTCPGWLEFIHRLEVAAGCEPIGPAGEGALDLVRRANRAELALRHRGQDALVRACTDALGKGDEQIPAGIRGLANIWWPLVITTNYDNLYPAAVLERWKGTRTHVFGRSPMHCFQVGRALRESMGPALWAVQGYLDAPCTQRFDLEGQLVGELVVGHAEYRRVTHREAHFRRTFAEVFRSRSLLFVGSGLEQYFLDLFSEIREIYGPNGHLHFALAPRGDLDVDFLLREFQIAVVEYDVPSARRGDHSERDRHLSELAHAIRRAPTAGRWDYCLPRPADVETFATFAVECSPLPQELANGACLAVSAGGPQEGPLLLSDRIAPLVHKLAPGASPQVVTSNVHRFGSKPVFAVVARDARGTAPGEGARTLAAVYWATRHLIDAAVAGAFCTLHAQLIASGPGIHGAVRPPFRPAHALAEMASAFGDAVRAGEVPAQFRMVVHVVDPSVSSELRRGRLSLAEYLSCDDLRIWVSIETVGAPPSYHILHVPATEFTSPDLSELARSVRLRDLSQTFSIPDDWMVDVWPSPQADWRAGTVEELGGRPVVFTAVAGSTVRFMSPQAHEAAAKRMGEGLPGL